MQLNFNVVLPSFYLIIGSVSLAADYISAS